MTNYNWKQIFETKTDAELLSIYSGNSTLDFEAEIYAGSELIERGFDCKKVLLIAENKSSYFRKAFLDASNPNKIKEYQSFYDLYFWLGFIPLVIFEVILIIKNLNDNDWRNDRIPLISLPIIMIVSFFDRQIRFLKYRAKIKKRFQILSIMQTF